MPGHSQRGPGVWRAAGGLAAVAALGLAACWSLRLAYADHLGRGVTREAVERAVRLAPGDARNHQRLAALDAGRKVSALRAALALNPRDSASWIELGLEAERRGELGEAERCLLEAAHVDRTLDPRWSLANYYFRQDDYPRFWHWAAEAAAMMYGDAAPLFRLCWRVTQDPEVMLARGLGDRPELLRQYLYFLLGAASPKSAEPVAQRLLERGDGAAAPVLLAYCDRWLEAGQAEPAARVWNALAARRWIPATALAPDRGLGVTNGDFSAPPAGSGFDWRVPEVPGAATTRTRSPAGLKITFSGRQPEECELLSQPLWLAPGKTYRLSYGFRTADIEAGSGLEWRVAGAKSGSLTSADWTEQSLEFAAPDSSGPARLVLAYRRAPGTTRIEGTLWLQRVALGLAR